MNPLRLIATAGLCTLSIASLAATGQGGGGGSGGGGHGSGAGHASSAAQTSGSRITRYDNPGVLHYLKPASGYNVGKYEGCGSAKNKPGCPAAGGRGSAHL